MNHSIVPAILSLALALSPIYSNAAESRPNVLIVLTDDQGTLDSHCYGSEDLHTPHMDRLAREGLRFTQAYAHAVCCPARAAFGSNASGLTLRNLADERPEVKDHASAHPDVVKHLQDLHVKFVKDVFAENGTRVIRDSKRKLDL